MSNSYIFHLILAETIVDNVTLLIENDLTLRPRLKKKMDLFGFCVKPFHCLSYSAELIT